MHLTEETMKNTIIAQAAELVEVKAERDSVRRAFRCTDEENIMLKMKLAELEKARG